MLDPVVGLGQVQKGAGQGRPAPAPSSSFADLLDRRLARSQPLRFSGHAVERLERRGIAVDESVLARLERAVAAADAKGSRSSLVLLDEKAFVVAVPTRTVVTALDRAHMREHVFTNIDSAVLA